MTSRIDPLLERNLAFAQGGAHEGAMMFPGLRLFVLSCIDPRTDPAHFLGLEPGEALISRNVGGRATPEVIEQIAFIGQIAEAAIPTGPLFEVAVIHHHQCGAGALADETFRRGYATRIGADESRLFERAVVDPDQTVRHDLELLRSSPLVPARVAVSAHVYDVTTGLLRTVGHTPPAGVEAATAGAPDERA
jgi:carbonic anhydrase